MAPRYEMDHVGLGRYLRESPELRGVVRGTADKLASEAIARSPRGRDRPGHRHFQDSIHVESGETKLARDRSPRMTENVVADSDDAVAVEFGTSRQPGHHVLGHLAD